MKRVLEHKTLINRLKDPRIFEIIFLLAMLISVVPYFFPVYRGVIYICFAWSAVLLVDAVYVKKYFWRYSYRWLIVGFLISYFISIVMNTRSRGAWVTEAGVFVCAIIYLVIFIVPYNNFSMQTIKRQLFILSAITSVVAFFISFVSYIMYITRFQHSMILWGKRHVMGVYVYIRTVRLAGIPGPIALGSITALSIALILLSFYLSSDVLKSIRLKLYWKIFCCASVVLHLLVLSATASYSAYIILFGFSFCFVFFVLIQFFYKQKKALSFINMLISLLCALLSIFIIYFICVGLQKTVNRLPYASVFTDRSSGALLTSDDLEVDFDGDISLEQISTNRSISTNFSTNRISIWKSVFAKLIAMPKHSFFGYAYANANVEIIYPDGTTGLFRNFHNGYISLLYSSGIIGFILLASLAVLLFWNCFHVLIANFDSEYYILLAMILSIIIGILGYNIAMEALILVRNVPTYFLWVFAGYLQNISCHVKKKRCSL